MLDALLASPSAVVVGATAQGTVSHWSTGAEGLYGWRRHEVLGRPLELLVPVDRRHELAVPEQLLSGVDVPPFETVRLHRDGRALEVELHVVCVRDADGIPVGTLALHRDLGRARRAERALSVTQDELRARFADSPLPQSRVGLDGSVLEVNAALAGLLGRPADELVGVDGLSFFADQDRAELAALMAQLGAGELGWVQRERHLRVAGGEQRLVLVTATPVQGADGSTVLATAIEDLTALRAAESRVHAQAQRFDALLETMPVVVFTYDRVGVCTSSRGLALSHLGLADDQLVGTSLLDMYAEVPRVRDAIADSLDGKEAVAVADAEGRGWKAHYRPVRDTCGEVVGGMGIAIDITDLASAERDLRASEALLRSLLQNASDVALVIDADGRISYISPAVRSRFGYDEPALFWRDANELNHPDDRRTMAAAWREVLRAPGEQARCEVRVRHADGSWRWADHVLTNLLDDPAVRGVVVNVRETTEQRAAEEELRRLAVRDALTGLANRTLLLDRTGQSLVAGRRTGALTGLVVLDVTGMGAVNEQLGQRGGDAVLVELARRLTAAARSTDSVARVGGDEFAVLVEEVGSVEDLRAGAAALLQVAVEPVDVDGVPVVVQLRAGSSLSPAADAGALLDAAERAVPRHDGSARVVVQAPTVQLGGVRAGLSASDRLRRAVNGGELVLHYQPVVDLASGVPAGVEALVRWQHPDHGLLPPSEFVPLAEASGLVVPLGAWVLREACTQLAAWHAEGRALAVGVNLSPRQLVGSAFPALVRDVLAETGVPAHRLVLEVTESALMDDPDAPAVLDELRGMGIPLALDDFGTGYSSLTYLKRFPVDAIKIDRSFVSGLGRDADDDAIVASVVSLARAVGKIVVAEGVETVEQRDALRALSVDQAQGYLWSRPLCAAELTAWLDTARPPATPVPPPAAPVPHAGDAPEGSDEERILRLHGEGASLHTIAAALNADGRRTAAGPRWTTRTVARVVAARVRPDPSSR